MVHATCTISVLTDGMSDEDLERFLLSLSQSQSYSQDADELKESRSDEFVATAVGISRSR